MKRKLFVPVAVLAALSLVGSACGKSTTTSNKPVLKIAALGALTGDYAQLVLHSVNAAEMAVTQANAKGDLPVTLELKREDTLGSKDQATPIANQLKDDASVVAILGPHFSGESFAVNPIFSQAGIPQITPSATNPGLNAIAGASGKTWWRAVGNDFSQGGPTPGVIFQYLKATKVYIAHDKSAYGQGLAEIVRDGVNSKYAGKLAGFEGVDPGKKDYSPLVSNVVSSKADVLFWGGYSPEGSLVLKQLRERGSTVKFVGADGSKDDTFLKVGTPAEGATLTCPCTDPNVATDAASIKFVQDYRSRWGSAAGIYAAEGYDAINIIVAAIKKAGKPGSDIKAYRAKVAANIKATSGFKGLTKTYSFKDNGELVDDQVKTYLYRVDVGKYKFLGEIKDLVQG